MPFIAPPTFSSGQILTASQLNVLSDDIEFLNSITDYINVPFSKYVYGLIGTQSMSEAKWLFRHRGRYLHYYLTLDTGDVDAPLTIKVNWGAGVFTVFSQSSSLTSPQTIAGYVDLDTVLAGLGTAVPMGAFMEVYWDTFAQGLATAHYFFESSFTVI